MEIDSKLSTRGRWARMALIPVIAAGALLVACNSDDDAEPEVPAGPQTYTVNAIDYGYENLPATVRVGDALTLTNSSATELHEIVALPLPEGEERSVEELLALPMEELMPLFAGMPAMVILTPPGSPEDIVAVGAREFATPGRYAVICGIPAGANPDDYLAAAAASGGEQPDVPGGPPHFAFGMFGEVTVTE